jgi:hypothetical protein
MCELAFTALNVSVMTLWVVRYGREDTTFRGKLLPPSSGKKLSLHMKMRGNTVEQLVEARKVTDSIPNGVIGILFLMQSFRLHYGFEVDSLSDRNT